MLYVHIPTETSPHQNNNPHAMSSQQLTYAALSRDNSCKQAIAMLTWLPLQDNPQNLSSTDITLG